MALCHEGFAPERAVLAWLRMNPPLPFGPIRARHPSRTFAVFCVLLLVACLGALSAGCGPSRLEKARDRLASPLAALADSGDVEALRVVADIEVLRADGMLSDSLANALTAMPSTEFFSLDEKGVRARSGRGVDITSLLAYTSAEPMLLKELVITPEQAAELRRLALDNMAAAAEMAAGFRGQGPAAPK